MDNRYYHLEIDYNQLLSLVKQLSKAERDKVRDELNRIDQIDLNVVNKDIISRVMRAIKPYFKNKLGKNTHKKSSDEWTFYGLAFTRADMVYIFGINVGFFKKAGDDAYSRIGTNVLVRTNGGKEEVRQQYLSFFRKKLKSWINQPEGYYTSDRGGKGVEFSRYKDIDGVDNEEVMIDFLKESIDGLHGIYPKIVENKNNLFDNVVRAAPQWDEDIIDFCKLHF